MTITVTNNFPHLNTADSQKKLKTTAEPPAPVADNDVAGSARKSGDNVTLSPSARMDIAPGQLAASSLPEISERQAMELLRGTAKAILQKGSAALPIQANQQAGAALDLLGDA